MPDTRARLSILAATILALASGVGCSEKADPELADQPAQETVAVPVLKVVDYTLTTHCGVRSTDFGGKQWITMQQDGTWHLIADDVAVFTSDGNPPLIYRTTGKAARNAGCA